MRQVTRKGLITVAAATGVLAVAGGYAHADSGASGSTSDSPGVLSGNNVQVPVHVPVNLCGNSVNVVGALNPSFGNRCANVSDGVPGGAQGGGAQAGGGASNSPGVGSGNQAQVPVDIPANVCGNSLDVIGLLNPTFGNECGNVSEPTSPPQVHTPDTPPVRHTAPPKSPGHPVTQTVTPPREELAETGSSLPVGAALPIGAAAVLGGALLYRRARAL